MCTCDRKIYYVDIGKMSRAEAQAYVNDVRAKLGLSPTRWWHSWFF